VSIPTPIQELIDSSGNTFHAKVAQWFVNQGWTIQVSPYYLDQTQQKAREIDLIAEKFWPFMDDFGKHQGYILVRLCIECKFVPSHAVFWFDNKNLREALGLVHRYPGFKPNNSYTHKHHYIARSERVAKLFSSSQTKQQETDLFYKALNQILNAFVAFRHRPRISEADGAKSIGHIVTLDYPVVVCSSFKNVYAVDFLGKLPTTLQSNNFQLEVQYAHGESLVSQRNEYFLVDFVSFDGLLSFSQMIQDDVSAAISLNS
jgi:hypothetical protein